jgi:hypothetical protein
MQSRPATSTFPAGALPTEAVELSWTDPAGWGEAIDAMVQDSMDCQLQLESGWRQRDWSLSKSSANFRRCCMLVGGWPTCRRGLHGLDDPSWDRLPSALIGKALGCGCCADGAVWTLCQAAGKAQRSAGLQWTTSDATKSKSDEHPQESRTTTVLLSIFAQIFPSTSSLTSYIRCLSAASPSRHGIAIAGWGPRYFPVLLNLFLDEIFPGSLRSRGCVGAKPTWSTAHRPQPATDEPLGLPNHTPETAQPRFARQTTAACHCPGSADSLRESWKRKKRSRSHDGSRSQVAR